MDERERRTSTGHASNNPTSDDIETLFTYHAPNAEQIDALAAVRQSAKHLALVILAHAPPCADRSAAIRKLREAVMTANAAIVLDGR